MALPPTRRRHTPTTYRLRALGPRQTVPAPGSSSPMYSNVMRLSAAPPPSLLTPSTTVGLADNA
eukprot:3302600-Pyramimonas_sp.AAC.1